MAVPEQTPYQEFIANGTTTVFPLNFDAKEQDHLIVLVDNVEPPVGEWSFDFNTVQVTFLKAPKANSVIKIRRDTPLQRNNDYENYNASLKPASVNSDFDNIWLKLQEMGVLNWMIDNNVKDLSAYVDSLNNETKAQFLAMIEKQGVSMLQLDIYVQGLYKKLANFAVEKGWLAEFIADGDENQKQINNRLKTIFVFPEHFNDDIIAAAAFAAANNATLVTKNKTYEMPQEFVLPENLTWLSCYTTIKQVAPATENRRASGIAPMSNVTIQGHLTVDMGTPTGGYGEKCHVRIDSFYNTTPKVKGFYFDTIKLKNGHFNCNGFVMAGGASLVRGKRLEVEDSDVMGRPFMAHWGNFTQHYNDDGTYRHVADYSPTTHPHDCIIDEITTGNLTCNTNDFCGVALVSAGYDIEIKKITGNLLDSTITGKSLVMFTAGDLAFAYASSEIKTHKMRNCKAGAITGTTYATGLGMIEKALYASNDDYANVLTPPQENDYLMGLNLKIDTIDCIGQLENVNSANNLINGANGGGSVSIHFAKARNFYSALATRNLAENITIDEMHVTNAKTNPVSIVGTGIDKSKLPKNISIKKIVLNKYGITSINPIYRYAIRNELSVNTSIGDIIVEEHGNAAGVVDTKNGIGENFKVNSISVNDSKYNQSYLISNSNRQDDPVFLGHYYAPSIVKTAVSGGVTFNANGRTRNFYSTASSSIYLNVGDTFTIVNVTPTVYLCTEAGVYGDTAKLKMQTGGTTFNQQAISIPANSSVLLTSGRSISYTQMGAGLKAGYSVQTNGIILMPTLTSDNTFSVYGYNPKNTTVDLPAGNMTVSV